MSSPVSRLGQLAPAVRLMVLATLLLGLGYPLLVTGIAQIALPSQADGSLVHRDGTVVGSSLVGQVYDDPAYFQGRPSAAGDGYDPLSTSASNLGLDSPELVKQVAERRAAAARLNGTDPGEVAPDALLASGSGLDPQISPEYAAQQVARVARERHLSPAEVRRLVADHTTGRTLGFLGEPRVDLLGLNLALDEAR
jgi:potassium-transporting ATPase KdpC subunit